MAQKKRSKKKAAHRAAPPTADRRVMFYRVDCGANDAGQRLPFDREQALRCINGLPWTAAGRYQATPDADVVCAWVDRIPPDQRMRFARVRRAGLPLRENGDGTLQALVIPQNSGLAEITHLVFFANNILGAVFNFHAPRATRLASYLRAKVPGMPPDLTIDPLIRADVVNELERFETIRAMDLKIRPSYASVVAQANTSLGRAFTAAQEAVTNNADHVQLVLQAGRSRRANLGQGLRTMVRRLAGRGDMRENATRFVVRGIDRDTQRTATLDLLNDQLVSTKRIIRQGNRSRALNNDSAYDAIEEAYAELRDQLEAAAAMGVDG